MSDTVKMVFKTLFKVPMIICISFLIFNLFAFVNSYLTLFGAYYVAVSTAIENNYIPSSEQQALEDYFDNISTQMLRNVRFTSGSCVGESERVQYGTEVTIGVEADFHYITPLMPREMYGGDITDPNDNTGKVTGLRESTSDNTINELTEAEREAKRNKAFTFGFENEVPGLRYYADLD